MGYPQLQKGYHWVLEHSTDDGATYHVVCGISSITQTQERTMGEAPVRPCGDGDDPFAAPSMARSPGAKSFAISGSGLFAAEFEEELQEAFEADESTYWRVRAKNGATRTGRFVMPSFEITAEADDSGYGQMSISLQSDGDYSYTGPA